MRKIILAGLAFMLLCAVVPASLITRAEAADEDWIEVGTPAELDAIRNDLTLNYRLTADIDLSGYAAGAGWEPIGGVVQPFTGRLDGNGYAIHNLTINRPSANQQGLFGVVEDAAITNLSLFNVNVSGQNTIGGLVSWSDNGYISAVTVEGVVRGNAHVGGIVGALYGGELTTSSMHGAVEIGSEPVPVEDLGGLVGDHYGAITGSYSTASIPDAANAGGLVGASVNNNVSLSYWDRDTSGKSASAGSDASFGKTTAEMKQQATYAGWDFTNAWGIVEHATYPLSRVNFDKIALESLVVADSDDGEPITFDREFDAGYGVYEASVFYRTDEITITPTAIDDNSIIAVEGDTALRRVALDPGANEIEITVTPASGPLSATYTLTVYRDEGTASSPHRIVSADQLVAIGDAAVGYDLSDAYVLESDLDLSTYSAGEGWEPVGSAALPFTGSFDGRGHTIRSLTIARPLEDGVGLFGGVAGGAELKDLALLNVKVEGRDQAGALVGSAEGATLSGITVRGEVDGAASVGGIVGWTTGLTGARLSMQGSVQASEDAGGLVGSADTSNPVTIEQSYSAASVTAQSGDSGGLIGTAGSGTAVTGSFWDVEASGQPASQGGGIGHTTEEMYDRSIYTGVGWSFGPGGWAVTNGSDYPMPYDAFDKVRLSGLAVTVAGSTVSGFGTFDPGTGRYDLTIDTPAANVIVTAAAADAGAAVEIDGIAGSTGSVGLGLDDNVIDVIVTNAGWQGKYRLHIAVPTPAANEVASPSDGWYGIGDRLTFSVSYDLPVDVASTPSLLLTVGTEERAALYAASDSTATSLTFRYTVQAGDADADGIAFADDAIAIEAPAAITSLNEAVPTSLAGLLPDLSGIRIDGVVPTIGLAPSITTPTKDSVDVEVTADGTGSAIAGMKWAAGSQDAAYFGTGGSAIAGDSFEVTANGIYTVYAEDAAGNRAVNTIEIHNLTNGAPMLTLTPATTEPVNNGVVVTVTAQASGEASGNAITALRWAAGNQDRTYFATGGTAITGGSFTAEANGTYTVYAADTAGNDAIGTVTIGNITTALPVLTLTPATTDLVNTGIEVSVGAEASDEAAGNAVAALKWAAGSRNAAYFGSGGGTAVTGGSFAATANGTYTVYAVDAAGNETVTSVTIDNIVTEGPAITVAIDPAGSTTSPVTVAVTAAANRADRGNTVALLKWAAGELDAAAMADPATGSELASGDSFQVTANGTFTLYAVDALGNAHTETIVIANIRTPSSTSAPYVGDPNVYRFLLTPGQPYTLLVEGMTLRIPAGAIDRSMTITIEVIKEASDEREIDAGLRPLSKQYEMTKNSQDPFKVPVMLEFQRDDSGLQEDERPAVYFYDEEAKRWVVLPSTADAAKITGETDHFTRFAVLAAPVPVVAGLTDLAGHWAEGAIREAVAEEIVLGYPDGTFLPDKSVSRAEFSLLLHRLLGWPAGPASAFADQRDVPEWAEEAVAAAVQAGVVGGYPDNSFKPNARVNRTEAAMMLVRAAEVPVVASTEATFADYKDISVWAQGSIAAAYEAGLIQGQAGNRFNPAADLTRAEAVVMLLRLRDYLLEH